MPVSTLATRRADFFDKATELRSPALAAVSATTSEPSISLLEIAVDTFLCVLYNTTYTGYVATTAQWTISVEVSALPNTGFVAVASAVVTLNGSNQKLQLPLAGLYNDQLAPNAAWIRVTATKTGTPGAISYGAFLSPESDYAV